jgi:hypothetical protein
VAEAEGAISLQVPEEQKLRVQFPFKLPKKKSSLDLELR